MRSTSTCVSMDKTPQCMAMNGLKLMLVQLCIDGQNNVDPNTALRTPQFYGLVTTFFCVACGGIGLFSVAKPMMGEVFSSTLPTLVTAGFASAYVQV